MEALVPILTSVGGSLASNLVGKMFGGGGGKEKKQAAPAALLAKPEAKKLFSPEQITSASNRYTQEGGAKWNQILANMGAAGGTGGPDVGTQIGTQASSLRDALGGLTTESGYGDNPMANMDAILKGVEGGINPKYSVY